MAVTRVIAAAAASVILAVGAASVAQAQTYKIKVAHGASTKHPLHQYVEMYKKLVQQKTGGRVQIQIFGNRKLGGDKDVLLGVKAGTIDSGLVSSVLFALIVRKSSFDALQLPFVVSNYDNLAKMLTSAPAERMLGSLDDIGIKGLGFGEAGLRHFLSSKGPVTTLAAFKGLKTRIVPVPLHKAVWQAVGANPVGIAYGEVYTSMQTKVIDAVEFNASSVLAENLYENAKHLSLTGHYFWPLVMIHNKAKFDKLPKDIQAAMLAAGREATVMHVNYIRDVEAKTLKTLKAKGVKVYAFKDLAGMRQRMQPIVAKWIKRDPIIADYVAHARKIEAGK
jgi:tripartite ATP-independent transporter DctP family solute receptor